MGLDHGRPHPGHGQAGAVQRVDHLRAPALCRPVTHVRPPGLVVAEPGDRRDLQPLVGTRGVDLQVEGPRRRAPQVTGAEVQDPVGQAQVGDGRLSSGQDVGVDLGGLLLGGIGQELDLVELVDPQQASGVTARRTGLTPEARRMGHELHGQVGLVEHLVTTERRERYLGGRNGPQVVTLQVVGVVLELGQVPGRHHGRRLDQRGWSHLAVGVGVAVQAVLDERPAEGGPHARVHHEHGAGELGPPLHVQDPQLLADLPVGHPLVLAVGVLVPVLVPGDDVVNLAGTVWTVG